MSEIKKEVEKLRKELKERKELIELQTEKKQLINELKDRTTVGKIKKRIKDQAISDTKKLGGWLFKSIFKK